VLGCSYHNPAAAVHFSALTAAAAVAAPVFTAAVPIMHSGQGELHRDVTGSSPRVRAADTGTSYLRITTN